MNRIFLLSTWTALNALTVHAQAPQAFEFQGVARNVAGDVLPAQAIALRLSIIQSSPGGIVFYRERQTPTTNQHGLFGVNIGTGTVLLGVFNTINWATGTYFLRVEMDPAGGTAYTDLGTTQLLSVPYALFAEKSNAWGLSGTAASATNFLGTTNSEPLRLKVNGAHAGLISAIAGAPVSYGTQAMPSGTGGGNTAIGGDALLANTTGTDNTAVGFSTLKSQTSLGVQNVAVGRSALEFNTSGHSSVAIGNLALHNNTSGAVNTAVGVYAFDDNLTGSFNTGIGHSSGPQAGFTNVSNATALGYATITDFSNQVHLGNSVINQIGGYEPWSDLSDIRFKKDVAPQTHGLDFILKLQPISYHMDVHKLNTFLYAAGDTLFDSEFFQQAIRDKEAKVYSGFSAQQVEDAAAQVGYEFSGVYAPQGERDHYSLAYSTFVVPLVKAVQEQQEMIQELRDRITELERR